MVKELFRKKVFNIEKALLFGFQKENNHYFYETNVMEGLFRLQIKISSEGNVETSLWENESGDEYILYKINAVGSFVGSVRSVIDEVLMEIAERCFDVEIFQSPQTKELICYVKEKYGDDLEFLWKKFDDNAIWRRKDTAKWYGAVLTVAKNKLGIDSDEVVEIIDLRIQPEKMEALLQDGRYYPGWHMSKKSWYTIILDGSVATEEICERIDESYRLAVGR